MASVKFSALVSDIRGKVGGAVFARGANGAYVRTFVKNKVSQSEVIQVKRNNLAVYAAKWRGLAEIERTQWIIAARSVPYQNRVGETQFYTGFQYFMAINMRLESAALDQ